MRSSIFQRQVDIRRPLTDYRVVGRSNRTNTEEFYEITDCSWTAAELNKEQLHRECVCNSKRRYQALKYKTRLQFPQDINYTDIFQQD